MVCMLHAVRKVEGEGGGWGKLIAKLYWRKGRNCSAGAFVKNENQSVKFFITTLRQSRTFFPSSAIR